MKLGILGTGMIVQDLLQVKDDLQMEKIYILGTEPTRPQTEELVQKFELDGAFYSMEDMLASDADTIYVALPNFLHYSFGKQALEAGRNVILEKPGTSNVEEFQDLIQIAKEKDLLLMEAMTIHDMPAYRELKEEIQTIGDLKLVNMNYSQYSTRYDAFKNGEILPAFDPAKSGGALMDINVYNVHAAVGLFGKPEKVSYQANMERGIDTSGILTLQYPGFQAVCLGAKDCSAPILSTFQGDEGSIIIDHPFNNLRSFSKAAFKTVNGRKFPGEPAVHEHDKDRHRMLYEFDAFRHMVDNHEVEEASRRLETSLTAAQVLQAARKDAGIVFAADQK